MAEAWTWTLLDASGATVRSEGQSTAAFPTQADAEAWFEQEWPELAEAGVAAVTLVRDGVPVYGPMKLSAD